MKQYCEICKDCKRQYRCKDAKTDGTYIAWCRNYDPKDKSNKTKQTSK